MIGPIWWVVLVRNANDSRWIISNWFDKLELAEQWAFCELGEGTPAKVVKVGREVKLS